MRGSSARQDMVDAAERLIAERGLAAVSLRDVQAAAGQRNKSAANYHFGSRDGLIDAVLEDRMGPINERRLGMLADIDAAGRGRDLRALVEAAVVPLAEATVGRPGSNYARFLAQLMTDPAAVARTRRHLRAESYRAVADRLAALVDHVPPALWDARAGRVAALVVLSLAGWEAAGPDPRASDAARVADLVDACVAVVRAPVSAATRDALAAGGTAGDAAGTGGQAERGRLSPTPTDGPSRTTGAGRGAAPGPRENESEETP